MNSQLKRLLLAAILSGTGFAATFLWYKLTDRSLTNNGEIPLAQVGSVSDEVLRRPPTRLLWHSVNTGDPLFNGEAIRTSQNGEVRIQFEDGRFIDLEADSLIVLSKAQGEISLDLMEGSLFVNAQAQAGSTKDSGLVLNSAQGKVDLSGASASLSKSDGKNLNLQVVEGSAKVQSKDGQTKEITSGKTGVLGNTGLQFDLNQIKIISPIPNKSVYIDPDKRPDVNFQWTGFPKDWKVTVYSGDNRKQMKEITSVAAGVEKTTYALPLGRHYWKIVAHNPQVPTQKAESSVYRLDVMARSTPALLAPSPGATLELEQLPGSVVFQWQKSEENMQLILEVAQDVSLQKKVLTKRVDGNDKYNLANLNEGTYYWRLSSFYPDVKEPWSGPVQQFKVIKKADLKPLQVQVAWNQVNPQQFFLDEPGLQLSWNAGADTAKVAQWKVSWREENAVEAEPQSVETNDKQMKAKLTKPGRYIASVEAIDDKGRSMGKSENLTVAVEPKPIPLSPQLLPLDGQLSSAADGRGEITWTKVEGAKAYKLTVTNKDGKELLKRQFDGTKTTLMNLMPGEYSLNIQSVDEHGRTSEKPTTRSLIVPDKSNLKAPSLKKVKVN